MSSNFSSLFNPKSIAVIGAADIKTKLGYVIVANLLKGKKRKIYPVNPSFKKVAGLRCLPSVKKISGKIDLAVIAVKPEVVPIVLKECGEKKISHVIIITAGYKEIGGEGVKREEELKVIAKKYKINLIGPNCLGVMDANNELNASFGNDLPLAGDIAFLSQSGALGTALLDWADEKKIGFSKFVSLGNAAGVSEVDFLEYLGEDKETSAIVMYLEGLSDGQKFVKVAKKITRRKPIIVIKAGRSEKGAAAVSSHTGSLAPSYEIFRAACRAAGVVTVNSLAELIDATQLALSDRHHVPDSWVILTNGGGPSIITADLLESVPNLSLKNLNDKTKISLKKVLPATASYHNPVDIIGDALEDRYEAALKVLTSDKENYGIITLLTPQRVTPVEKIAKTILKYKDKKTIIPLFIGGKAIEPAEEIFAKAKVLNFRDPAALVKAVAALSEASGERTVDRAPATEKKTVAPLSDKFRQMGFNEAAALLSKYDLKAVGNFVDLEEKLNRFENKIPFPWAMKVVSPEVIHKTDFSGVKININSLTEAKKAWQEMSATIKIKIPNAQIDGFVVQAMVSGIEVVVGVKQDPGFGPVIVFGAGGIYTEILKDAVSELCPVNEARALAMMEKTKIYKILSGARGQKTSNIKALVKIISALSHLAAREKRISEVDLNPVIVNKDNAVIVDVRVMVEVNSVKKEKGK